MLMGSVPLVWGRSPAHPLYGLRVVWVTIWGGSGNNLKMGTEGPSDSIDCSNCVQSLALMHKQSHIQTVDTEYCVLMPSASPPLLPMKILEDRLTPNLRKHSHGQNLGQI